MHSVFLVGLTGGVASGKTTVANLFAALGVPIIDTDLLAREVVAPGTALLGEIAGAFRRRTSSPPTAASTVARCANAFSRIQPKGSGSSSARIRPFAH